MAESLCASCAKFAMSPTMPTRNLLKNPPPPFMVHDRISLSKLCEIRNAINHANKVPTTLIPLTIVPRRISLYEGEMPNITNDATHTFESPRPSKRCMAGSLCTSAWCSSMAAATRLSWPGPMGSLSWQWPRLRQRNRREDD